MNPNDSAFPNPNGYARSGLTVRAYIAAKALQGILAREPCGASSAECVAEDCVKYADALIAELSK